MTQINFLAVLVAALSSFMLGGLWYSNALFGMAWREEAGVPGEGGPGAAGPAGHPARVFASSRGGSRS